MRNLLPARCGCWFLRPAPGWGPAGSEPSQRTASGSGGGGAGPDTGGRGCLDGYFYKHDETFQGIFGAAIAEVRRLSRKPLLIAETGADPQAGQTAKIVDMFAGVKAAGLLGLVWFDAPGYRDWEIDSNPSALAAFGASARKDATEAGAP